MPLSPQFDHVFQLMPNPSLILLPDAPKFTIVAANNAYLEVMDLSEKDLIGKGIFDAFPKNPANTDSTGVKNLRSSLKDVISKKESHKMSLQKYNIPLHRTSGFKVKYGILQNIPIKNRDNNITHILHSIEDLTDKRIIEIALETERQRFNDLYWQAPSCMAILKGPDHVYEMANNSYLQLINKKNIIGKSFKKIRPETAEQGLIEIMDQVYKTGKAFSANEMLIKLDKEAKGEIVDFYHDLLIQPHKDHNGKIDGIFFFFIDVTEKVESRKKIEESEKRYRELIENLPVAAYSCDAEGHILVYNKTAAALWGREPKIKKDKWSGSWKVYNKNGNPLSQDMCPIAIALKEGSSITDQEIIIERPNGDKLNIVSHPVPFMDSSGRITGAVNMLIDITESKKAELKLIQSEKRLKEAQEMAHLGNWELNLETGISLWSDEACKIFGLSPKVNKHTYSFWLSFIHPNDVEAVLELIDESKKTLSDIILNYRIILKDGTIKFIYEKTRFEFDNNQKLIGLHGIAQDVTDTVKAEEKVGLQSNLLNIITQAAISTNEYGIINFWNKAATEIYGWTAEEALGKNAYSLISTVRKEGHTLELMEKLSKGNTSSENEYVVKHKDGHTFSVFASISPIYGKQGRFKGGIEVSMDITERKNEEEKFADLHKELSDYKYALDESYIVAITDQKGTIKHVNDNFCKITQFSPEELIGQNHRIINSGYHSKEFFRDMWKIISSGKIWKGEVKNKAKDGSIYWVDTVITPLLDERGKPYKYVVTRFNITKAKKTKENIKKKNVELIIQYEEKRIQAAELFIANKELLKTNTELDRFVYSVSHDLRSPLTSILGLISFIEEDSREPETLEQVKMIRASINRLDGFIKNILSYSQNNRTGLEMVKIPIGKTIHEIINSLRNIKEADGISFQVDIDEQQPFYSDWQRLNTILENLISNAIKYHTEDVSGRYLNVTGTTDNEGLKLSISDNGVGIDAAYHEKIFDMFYRLSGKIPGSGFGLYIVKETLEKMNGKIEVQSEKGVGSTFTITLKNLRG
jgi:PAS domain S-box-containing protein